MSRRRLGLIAVAVAIGAVAALTGVWWTVAAMACVVVSQLASERAERRRSSTAGPATASESAP